MQEVSEACSLDDDMADGDLGDGMGVRAAPSSTRKKSQSFAGLTETLLSRTEALSRSSYAGDAAWIPGLKTAETQQRARWKLPRSSSLVDLSKDELKDRLQEATEVIDVLCCELEVAHRYLEGKYRAMKILQGKAIFDKATSHTKSLLQKSEARAKALEKEVNSLQWEVSFSQVQMKKSQQTWEQKYNRVLSDNKTLTDSLEEREREIQLLRAENSARSRQYLELLSMLSVKEQRTYQGTKPQYSPERDAGVLELAVLGACRCPGAAEACPCSRAAAASRKQLIQLQQELDAQRARREEALMVADAFRIAFEQQLRKRSEHFLLLAEANILKSHHCKAEGANRSPLISVSQKLRGLLPSKMPEDLLETLYRLLDLLNDKEEALAHQRKVSIMLAHSAEELERRLHLDSHCRPSDSSENQSYSRKISRQTSDSSENQSHSRKISRQTSDSSENQSHSPKISQQTSNPSENQEQSRQTSDPSENEEQSWQTSDPSENEEQSRQTSDPSENQEQSWQTSDPSENQEQSRKISRQTSDPSENEEQSRQTSDPSENEEQSWKTSDPSENQEQSRKISRQTSNPSENHSRQTSDPSENQEQSRQTSDPSETKIEPQVSSESNIQAQQQLELADSPPQPGPSPHQSESRTEPQELSDPSQSNIQPLSNHESHESELQQSDQQEI